MSDTSPKVEFDRQLLLSAQEKGRAATLGAYVRLSGPGWLQSAITLGGGSLAGALFLGVLGGTSLLWLQLMAIIMGVIMLSAISYVTLSTRERPFYAIKRHINPVLAWGWIIATIAANMIWCMPQFSLCFEALQKNLVPGDQVSDDLTMKLSISLNILMATGFVVLLQASRGRTARIFDWFLKLLVATIVVCFVGVVVYLAIKGILDWGGIFTGYVPDVRQAFKPSGDLPGLLAQLPEKTAEFWDARIVGEQRRVMIGAAATAVGINMTFLMPYAMLNRGWDKPFRGLARFDLGTGLAIPYILVTSCVVIAAAQAFHGRVDDEFLSHDPHVMRTSRLFGGAKGNLLDRIALESESQPRAAGSTPAASTQNLTPEQKRNALAGLVALSQKEEHQTIEIAKFDESNAEEKNEALTSMANRFDELSDEEQQQAVASFEKLSAMAALPGIEKRVAGSLVRRDGFQLSQALEPLLGEKVANVVFGLGIFGMGFSTIIILMLINGFAFSEMFGRPQGGAPHIFGCLVAGIAGASWPFIWAGESKIWLAILVSNFGMMFLPIAYVTFFAMMNSKRLMGEEKPTGAKMAVWNVLMAIAVLGSIAAASWAIYGEATDETKDPTARTTMLVVIAVFAVLTLIGFFLKKKHDETPGEKAPGEAPTPSEE